MLRETELDETQLGVGTGESSSTTRRAFLSLVAAAGATALADGGRAAQSADDSSIPQYSVLGSQDVSTVWSGHPVGFALYTHESQQFVAFYDEDRQMTVGQRQIGEADWSFVRLPEEVGWDSHNAITMTVDSEGLLHLSGNMHGSPLVYFRSSEPLDIHTLERIDEMVGTEEEHVTYPRFFRGPDDELIFTYRDGASGDGTWIYNRYDLETRTWSRLLDQPLLDGEGEMGAYPAGPLAGPDGYFHLLWMWRDTGSAATNHTLSYARSADLVNWETADGESLDLPITPETEGVVADPVPPYGGMINMNFAIGFDQQDRVVLSYHKYDDIQERDSTLTVPDLTGADWIWYPEFDENTRREWDREKRFFRREFDVDPSRTIDQAVLMVTADTFADVNLNGEELGGSVLWDDATGFDVTGRLSNQNALTVRADPGTGGYAGLLCRLEIRFANGETRRIDTDESWIASRDAPEGWTTYDFDDAEWPAAKSAGTYPVSPWGDGVALPDSVKQYHPGNTQAYSARLEGDSWEIYQTSDWDFRWEFDEFGSIPARINIGPVEVEDGQLVQRYSHPNHGDEKWILDEQTLNPVDTVSQQPTYPSELTEIQNPDLGQPDVPELPGVEGTDWIWYPEFDENTRREWDRENRYFRRTFDVDPERTVDSAVLLGTADFIGEFYLNGEQLGSTVGWSDASWFDVTDEVAEQNVLAVRADPGEGDAYAGLLCRLEIRFANGETRRIDTDESWIASRDAPEGWTASDFDDAEWPAAKSAGTYPVSPWGDGVEVGSAPEPADVQVNWARDLGESCDSAVSYVLRWETLETNQDRPRSWIPDPTGLQLFKLIDSDVEPVDVEVKSQVNPESNGVIPVSIESDAALDVPSLRFGAPRAVLTCDGASAERHPGRNPAVVRFPTEDTCLEHGDERAVLRGETEDGEPIYGETLIDLSQNSSE